MDLRSLKPLSPTLWEIPAQGAMRVPARIVGSAATVQAMDLKVYEQLVHVTMLPGIVDAAYALPDAHGGAGFPIGTVAAVDPQAHGVISAGGVGLDIACGVRCLCTNLTRPTLMAQQGLLADALYARIPAGVTSPSALRLTPSEIDLMLTQGARWALARGWGHPADLLRVEAQGCQAGADPGAVSAAARLRQRDAMGTLGSGDHYLEVQVIHAIYDATAAAAMGLTLDAVVVMIHCGSRGLGHQVGTDYLRQMAASAPRFGMRLPNRELAYAPIDSKLGRAYLGAMRAAINCALANRQILTHWTRDALTRVFPGSAAEVLYDVSHNTCQLETHNVTGQLRDLYVHRKGATRARGPGHADLPEPLRRIGQPVLMGGSMGTGSWIMAGTQTPESLAWQSACHGAGRAISRHQAHQIWRGRAIVDELTHRGILMRSPSLRGAAEEAPMAYKDIDAIAEDSVAAGLARKVARLEPLIVIKG